MEGCVGITSQRRTRPWIVIAVIGVVALAAAAVYMSEVLRPWLSAAAEKPPRSEFASLGVQLVPGIAHTLHVPEEVRTSLGARKGQTDILAVAQAPTQTQTMVLPSSTALDPTRLWRIHARFAPARVVEIA